MNTITIEGVVTEDPDLSYGFEHGTQAHVVLLEIARPLRRPPYVHDPFFVLVVSAGALGAGLVGRVAKGYTVLVIGRLDCFELPTEDGSHLCQHVIAATPFDVVSDVPF